jgi:hypothetical protein
MSLQDAAGLVTLSGPYGKQRHPDAKSVWFVALATKAALLVLDKASSPSTR